jgi:hypothetical protein
MRILTMLLGALLMTLAATEVSATETCRIETGYGTAIGTGPTKLKAKEAARLECGSKLIDMYQAQRGKIDPSADLELACINLECTK